MTSHNEQKAREWFDKWIIYRKMVDEMAMLEQAKDDARHAVREVEEQFVEPPYDTPQTFIFDVDDRKVVVIVRLDDERGSVIVEHSIGKESKL